jgi:hypothetical protein
MPVSRLGWKNAGRNRLYGRNHCLMLAFINWLLLNGRTGAMPVAQQMNRDLIDSECRWHHALEGAGDSCMELEPAHRYHVYAGCWKQMLAIAPEVPERTIGKWQQRRLSDA